MVPEHLSPGEESPAEAFLSQKAQQARLPSQLVFNFYRSKCGEDPLPLCNSVVCQLQGRKPQGFVWVVKMAQSIAGTLLPDLAMVFAGLLWNTFSFSPKQSVTAHIQACLVRFFFYKVTQKQTWIRKYFYPWLCFHEVRCGGGLM